MGVLTQESTIRLPPVRAIRKYCKTICAGSPKEARLCPVLECPLHQYRQGKHPARTGIGGGQRGSGGVFWRKNKHSESENLITTPKKGLGRDEVVPIHSGSINGSYATSKVEVSKGEVRIEKTSSGLLIRLTQEPQH